jgi:hypothetical protein
MNTDAHLEARSGDAVGRLDESTLMGPGLWLRQNRDDSLS